MVFPKEAYKWKHKSFQFNKEGKNHAEVSKIHGYKSSLHP